MTTHAVTIRKMPPQEYVSCWQAMKSFTDSRDENTQDEIWLLEHFPVFTQGQNGKPEHVLDAGAIPIIQSDRGGQVTYHGPGQLMVYTLVDVKRKKLNVRQLVTLLEQSVIQLLAHFQIEAQAKCEAPGVYVNQQKIASIGLRIRRGCAYHGFALNVAMDLTPFTRINPCGYSELKMIQLADLIQPSELATAETKLIEYLMKNLGYTSANH